MKTPPIPSGKYGPLVFRLPEALVFNIFLFIPWECQSAQIYLIPQQPAHSLKNLCVVKVGLSRNDLKSKLESSTQCTVLGDCHQVSFWWWGVCVCF